MLQVVLNKSVVLQVPLYGVKLDHRIGDRRSGCKHRTTTARNLVKVAALHKKVAGFLCFGLCDTTDIPHFCIEKKVLVIVALINEKPVHAKFLKSHNIVLFRLVVELVELLLDRFLCALQLFYGEVISTVLFQFRNALRYLIKLLFEDRPLPFNGHRYFLELRMPDNDGIVIAGGNSAAELFAVLGFKVFLRCHQNIGRGVEL